MKNIGPVVDLRDKKSLVIGSYAFAHCTDIQCVHLPKDVYIGTKPFNYCTNLTEIVFHGMPFLFQEDDALRLPNLKKVIIYDTTEEAFTGWLMNDLETLFGPAEVIFK